MYKLQQIDLHTDSFFAGMLFPFVDEGKLFLLVLSTKNKYNPSQPNIKFPGGTGDRKYSKGEVYLERLEEILTTLSFDRIATLKVLNQEYDRRAEFMDHPEQKRAMWILQTLVLECLESTGYYPADISPWVVDVVERSDNHYQYFLEITELWDKNAEAVKIPQQDESFTPIDQDVISSREKMPIMDFEEILIDSHKRPVEFYIEHLKSKAGGAGEE
ncbi:MAG: hypothetical protein KDC34_15520 [Saprospiraceae bacterium]|nr:hypothetical protein [Saprospiraceae bacterium]